MLRACRDFNGNAPACGPDVKRRYKAEHRGHNRPLIREQAVLQLPRLLRSQPIHKDTQA